MIIIEEVELNNWFNYSGDYERNRISFTEGVNLFCADNNAGKSKLHAALSWLLTDEVILDGGLLKVDRETIDQVANKSYYSKLNSGDEYSIGVCLTFRKVSKSEERRLQIWQEVRGKRDGDCRVANGVRTRGRGNSWVNSSTEDFGRRRDFIGAAFQKYLFLEGEQLKGLIPFAGNNLRNTIDEVTEIQAVDKVLERNEQITTQLDKLLNSKEKAINEGNNKVLRALEKIAEITEEVKQHQDTREVLINEIEELKVEEDRLKERASNQKETQKVIKSIELYEGEMKMQEGIISNLEAGFYQLISKRFLIKGFLTGHSDDNFVDATFREFIESKASDRRAELDSGTDEEEKKMVSRLIKNQPGVEILEEILNGGRCYVCGTREISKESRNYIENHLIPHFRGDMGLNDEGLSILQGVNQLWNAAVTGLGVDVDKTDEFDEQRLKIGKAQEQWGVLSSNLDRIIKTAGGDPRKGSVDTEVIEAFGRVVAERTNKESALKELKGVIEALVAKKKELRSVADTDVKGGNNASDDIRKALVFQEELASLLKRKKREIYTNFCRGLEELSTERLHKYFGKNAGVLKSKFKVEMGVDFKDEVDFHISVTDEYGNTLTSPGGAETQIRQYCVVLSLLELAKASKAGIGRFPFILDAPLSNVNPSYLPDFYDNLLREDVSPQMIIMTYDLVGGTPVALNDLGESVKSKMKESALLGKGRMLFKKDRDAAVQKVI